MATLVDIDLTNWEASPPAVTGQVIRPSSDFDVELSPSEGTNWGCVLYQDDGKYVTNYSAGIATTDYYGMTDIAATPTSGALRSWFFSKYVNFGTHHIRGVLTTHGESYYTNWVEIDSTYKWFTCDWETNPYTGSAWTKSEINALKAGLAHLRASGGNPRTDCFFVEAGPVLPGQIWVEGTGESGGFFWVEGASGSGGYLWIE